MNAAFGFDIGLASAVSLASRRHAPTKWAPHFLLVWKKKNDAALAVPASAILAWGLDSMSQMALRRAKYKRAPL
jgi:hypothetical protein